MASNKKTDIKTSVEVILMIVFFCITMIYSAFGIQKGLLPFGLLVIVVTDFIKSNSTQNSHWYGKFFATGGFLAGLGFHYFL